MTTIESNEPKLTEVKVSLDYDEVRIPYYYKSMYPRCDMTYSHRPTQDTTTNILVRLLAVHLLTMGR